MEFEEGLRNDARTAAASTSLELYRSCFLASCRYRSLIVVPASVAVRAQQVALRSFGDESFPRPAEVPKTELLRLRVPVVKLQRGNADVIAAVFTTPASDFDQALLALYPPPSLTAVRRLAPPLSSIGIRVGSLADRLLRRVVISERRARQTEAPSIKRSQLSVDQLLCRELAPAPLTDQHPRWARVIEAGVAPRLEGETFKAQASPMQMATLSVDDLVVAEG